ncbi:aldo/keto reductase [Enterovibrio sp. ZSDZ35]|uniref:Aldo/keto reductase n=1 Tax=Enterovibrio qingdaonensis TaxID=2899818 RepID=A0ABT5QJ36_9GAMM|nr:aldo/keto reductase [Enterovibrio sp. ZSDZ35]MDD1781000.1 aldo/keto reductase [Enterovibrio sp. ZSDZ35]
MKAGLGTAAFGTTISSSDAFDVLNAFIHMGGTVVDTANAYAFWAGKGGESEEVVGEWLKTIDRSTVEIHTKIGAMPLDGKDFATAEGLSKAAIDNAIVASLERLNTDYIDVLYAHIDDLNTPLEETWRTLTDYVSRGIVKKLGVSNYTLDRLSDLCVLIERNALEPISYAQYRHTVIPPKPNLDFGVQLCLTPDIKALLTDANPDVVIIAYSPLLNGAFEHKGTLPEEYDTPENKRFIAELRAEADMLLMSPSAIVLRNIVNQGIFPVCMTGSSKHLKENLMLVKKLR